MKSSRRHRPLVIALYVNAFLLLAILVTLQSRGQMAGLSPTARAAPPVAAPQPIAGNGTLCLMPGQLLNNVWGCYVLDVENQTLVAYSYNGNQLRLVASRNIRFDHQLDNYNTHPDPEEIRKLVEIERKKVRGLNTPADVPAATQEVRP